MPATTPTKPSFWGLAIVSRELLPLLLKVGSEKSFITYGEVAFRLNLSSPLLLSPLLHPLCCSFYRRFKVLPGSVVVSKATGYPGKGYFKFIKSLGINFTDEPLSVWRRELEKFYSFCGEFDGNLSLLNTLFSDDTLFPPLKRQEREEG